MRVLKDVQKLFVFLNKLSKLFKTTLWREFLIMRFILWCSASICNIGNQLHTFLKTPSMYASYWQTSLTMVIVLTFSILQKYYPYCYLWLPSTATFKVHYGTLYTVLAIANCLHPTLTRPRFLKQRKSSRSFPRKPLTWDFRSPGKDVYKTGFKLFKFG